MCGDFEIILDQSVTIDLLYGLAVLGYEITFKGEQVYICKVDDDDD